jgi:large subunit ribosomal protein L10
VRKLKREEKIKVVSELQDKFQRAKGIIFTDYRGLTVQEMSELRSKLRASALEYKVVKNTLAKRAAEGTPVESTMDIFSGPVGVVFSYDDPVVLTKEVLEFVKSNEKLKIKGGVIEGGICSAEELNTISKLPPREVLMGMFVRTMQAPLSRFASALRATLLRFIYAMEALKNKKESR